MPHLILQVCPYFIQYNTFSWQWQHLLEAYSHPDPPLLLHVALLIAIHLMTCSGAQARELNTSVSGSGSTVHSLGI